MVELLDMDVAQVVGAGGMNESLPNDTIVPQNHIDSVDW